MAKLPTVDEFMAALDHPYKAEVQAVRETTNRVVKRSDRGYARVSVTLHVV